MKLNGSIVLISISGAIALILLIGIVYHSMIHDSVLISMMTGAYFTVVGVFGGLVFTDINRRLEDDKHKELMSELCDIRDSLNGRGRCRRNRFKRRRRS